MTSIINWNNASETSKGSPFYLVFVRRSICRRWEVYAVVDIEWRRRRPHTSPATARCRYTRSLWRQSTARRRGLTAPVTDLHSRMLSVVSVLGGDVHPMGDELPVRQSRFLLADRLRHQRALQSAKSLQCCQQATGLYRSESRAAND